VIPSDDYQGEEMVRLATELGYENAGILYVNDAYGVGIRDVFSEGFGTIGEIIIEEAFESESTDFKTQLTKIKASNPDVIIMIARKEFPLILKQAKELGLNAQIIASETLKSEELIQASGDSANGILITYFTEPVDYVNFKAKFQAKYGTDPSSYSDFGYDALKVLAIAIENANSTNSEKVKHALHYVAYQGATGVVKFDSNGEITGKPFTIYKVMDGKIKEFKG
jgi:branched-chain amino acid transport system substrate-binding protein